MTFPHVPKEELQHTLSRNREDRLMFVRSYAAWVKKTPNKIWSAQQKKLFT